MLRNTLYPAVRAAILQVRRSPLRFFWVLQGVTWATVLGILPPAVIRGSREAAVERAEELGTDRIYLHDGPGEGPKLGWEAAARIEERFKGQIRSAAAAAPAPPLLLVGRPGLEGLGRELASGRWLSEEEISKGAPVCLISDVLAREKFPGRDPLGQELEIPQPPRRLKVVGTFRLVTPGSRGLDSFGYAKEHPLHGLAQELLGHLGVFTGDFDWLFDERLVAAPRGLLPEERPGLILARASPEAVSRAAKEIRLELVRQGFNPVVVINPVVQVLFSGPVDTIRKMQRVVFIICLIAGTVIVANIMILSILERQREIAIRRVEGATTVVIGAQFLLETAVHCLLGTLLGIPLAVLIAWLRTAVDPNGVLHWIFPIAETFQTVASVGALGMLGGILPALRAARVDPVKVLSSE